MRNVQRLLRSITGKTPPTSGDIQESIREAHEAQREAEERAAAIRDTERPRALIEETDAAVRSLDSELERVEIARDRAKEAIRRLESALRNARERELVEGAHEAVRELPRLLDRLDEARRAAEESQRAALAVEGEVTRSGETLARVLREARWQGSRPTVDPALAERLQASVGISLPGIKRAGEGETAPVVVDLGRPGRPGDPDPLRVRR